MNKEVITYDYDGKRFHGYLCHNRDIKDKRPGIIVCHAWRGIDSYTKQKAEELARLGYIVFVADVFGNEQPIKTNEEALHHMTPLFLDRALLLKRVRAGLDQLCKQPLVDHQHLGAIGFCFGGLTALELFRSGADLKGTVIFHGLLGDQLGQNKAKTIPIASSIKGSIIILHGHDDPLVSKEDVALTQERLTAAGIDWQMHIYGHTSHAFTNPEANEPSSGLLYNEKSDRRSWRLMKSFFSDVFQFS